SSFVSLTLVPAAASRLPADYAEHGFRRFVVRLGTWLNGFYSRSLTKTLDHPWVTVAVAVIFAGGMFSLLPSVDRELLPEEDRGIIQIWASGPDGVGLGYIDRQTDKVEDIVRPIVENGEATALLTLIGAYDPNRSITTLPLADWHDRERSQQEIIASLEEPLADIPGAFVSVRSANSLNLRRAGGGIEVALVGNDYDTIFEAAKTFVAAVEDRLTSVRQPRLDYDPTQPQLSVRIDRRRAADLGIDLANLGATMRAMVNGDELIDLNVDDEAVPILLESSSGEINDPSDLVNLYISTSRGDLVPLSSIVTITEEGVAAELGRVAQRRAIEVDMTLASAATLADAVDDLKAVADDVLPSNISMVLRGEAAELEETSRDVLLTYAIALAVIFLVLAAQFEGFSSAVVVTLIVPFGLAAAVVALVLTGTSINIYSQIGLVLLIGLMAKNSVLLVEFADQLRDLGRDLRDAVETGAAVRLRPVAMTMVSTVLGGLPLILSSGAGAEARASIGWVVFGGLGLAAVFTLYLTPSLYILIARYSDARAHEAERLEQELVEARQFAEDAR
ncbi:MAG: efflux RND transporter permease subunit, partial [Pseudomonadota bacterium]